MIQFDTLKVDFQSMTICLVIQTSTEFSNLSEIIEITQNDKKLAVVDIKKIDNSFLNWVRTDFNKPHSTYLVWFELSSDEAIFVRDVMQKKIFKSQENINLNIFSSQFFLKETLLGKILNSSDSIKKKLVFISLVLIREPHAFFEKIFVGLYKFFSTRPRVFETLMLRILLKFWWKPIPVNIPKIDDSFLGDEMYKGSWIFVDRLNKADDNAEHFYRYMRKKYPNKKIYFILIKFFVIT
jgi:hypothetical protein